MTIRMPDRTREVTSTTGTGPYTLEGNVPGRLAFADTVPDGRELCYTCEMPGTDLFEIGIGIYRAATNTIERLTVIRSSNNGQPVSWPAGAKAIFGSLSENLINTNDTTQHLGTWYAGETHAIDRADGNLQEAVIAGDVTITDFVGVGEVLLTLRADAVGNHTVTWPAAWRWIGPTPAAAYAADQIQVFKIFRVQPGGDVYAYETGGESLSLGSQGELFDAPGGYTVDVPVGLKNLMKVWMWGAGGGACPYGNGAPAAALYAVLDLTHPDVQTLLGLYNNQLHCVVGAGGTGRNNALDDDAYCTGSGGGLTGIQLGGYILVAGSGGGGGYWPSGTSNGGPGAYPAGGNGAGYSTSYGRGGTQTTGGVAGANRGAAVPSAPGAALAGGRGGLHNASGTGYGGAGGDGYYGGGGGAWNNVGAGGGGGSSFHNATLFGDVGAPDANGVSSPVPGTGLGAGEIAHYNGTANGPPGNDGHLYHNGTAGQRGINSGDGGHGLIVITFE